MVLDQYRVSSNFWALMSSAPQTEATMESIVALCRRRGFIFQSSEIYGGINGFFDYGPLGVELRRNIREAWWHDMVQLRDDIVGLDSSIIMHGDVWKASGHVDGFADPMVDCKESKLRYKADQIFFSAVSVDGETIGYVSVLESPSMDEEALGKADKLKRKQGARGELDSITLRDFTQAAADEIELIPSPATGKPGSLTPPRDFNMMFQTYVGALRDESAVAYLRPETAQGIFANFRNIVDSGRLRIPFGIAQIGKAFRNEITPRNFIFRSREFEQMEIEYFIAPGDQWKRYHEEWIDERLKWFDSIGLGSSRLGRDVHAQESLAHYAKACTDITFNFPFGVKELEGIAARGDYDLRRHGEESGKSMEYFDDAMGERYVPHVIEPSLGVDRTLLALLCSAYQSDQIDGEQRHVLRFRPRIAPYKAGVFPLLKNKPDLVDRARAIHSHLRRRWNVFYDESGAIGRRYRRQDEAGTPFGVTVDFQTLEDKTVTIRDRDTTEQVRIPEDGIAAYIEERVG